MIALDRLEGGAASLLRPNTAGFVSDHEPELDRRLEPLTKELRREVDRLRGAEGLLVKRHFLAAAHGWERYFWAQVGRHLEGQPLDEAVRRADEDVLFLVTTLPPL